MSVLCTLSPYISYPSLTQLSHQTKLFSDSNTKLPRSTLQGKKFAMKAAKSWWPTNPTPDDDADESLLGGERISKPAPPRHTIRRHLAYRWPWALSTLLFACTTAVLFVKSLPAVNPTSRSCDPWRKTDFGEPNTAVVMSSEFGLTNHRACAAAHKRARGPFRRRPDLQ